MRVDGWYRIGIATVLVAALSSATMSAQQLVLIVRHAERADGGAAAGQMQAQTDPGLSPAGAARAAKLARMLADAGVTAVFATEYRRTRDTVKPLADKLGLTVQVNPGRETGALVSALKARHANDVVLIAGHSNTVPELIAALGGPTLEIADDEYDNLFVVVPATGTLMRIRY